LFNYLSNNSGVSELAASRVYPGIVPQQVSSETTRRPCLTFIVDTESRDIRFSGSDTLVRGGLTVECSSRTYAQSQELAKRVRAALVDYSGLMVANTSPVTSVRVQHIFLDGEASLIDEEPGLYLVMQRYVIWYDEA
jgi:hypothetical protein